MTKTIILWGNDDLLSSYVEYFLINEKGWKVISIPIEQKVDAVIHVVDKINPNIVIIQHGDQPCDSGAPTILLRDHPDLQVITLSLKNNLMEVYQKQNILIHSATDIISIIEAQAWGIFKGGDLMQIEFIQLFLPPRQDERRLKIDDSKLLFEKRYETPQGSD